MFQASGSQGHTRWPCYAPCPAGERQGLTFMESSSRTPLTIPTALPGGWDLTPSSRRRQGRRLWSQTSLGLDPSSHFIYKMRLIIVCPLYRTSVRTEVL